MPPVTGPFPYDRLLRELELKDEASERPRDKASVSKTCDSPQSSKAYDEARDGAVIIMAVSLPWLAFAVFHSPFLTAFFAITTLLSGAVLVGPAQIQAATGKLKEVFKAAGNKIRAGAPAKKPRSNTIRIQPSPVSFERHTQGDEVPTSLRPLSKDFKSAAHNAKNEALSPNSGSGLTAKRNGFNL